MIDELRGMTLCGADMSSLPYLRGSFWRWENE